MSSDVLDVADVDQLPDDDDQAGDDFAPYGFLKDGVTPKRKPGPAPGAGKTVPPPRGRRTSRRRTSAGPAVGPTVGTPRAAAAAGADKTMVAGAQALLQIPAQLLSLAGMALGLTARRIPDMIGDKPNPRHMQVRRTAMALTADSCTLMVNGPQLAEGMAGLADDLPWLAAVYAKAAQLGPHAALLQAGTAVLLQGLTNHGVIPPHPMLGTIAPEDLIAQVMEG